MEEKSRWEERVAAWIASLLEEMDFFSEHPDDAAARNRELVEDKPLVQADVLTPEQSSVPARV
jgi:hypothetical protein